jgi:IS605 OrfB family transposase
LLKKEEKDQAQQKKKKSQLLPKTKKNSNKPPAGKTRKIRLYPNKSEREKLDKWFGAARWTYNECLRAVYDLNLPLNLEVLRNFALNNEAIVDKPWLKETPYDVRDEALRDLIKAFDSNFAKGAPFKIKFRKKKRLTSESIVILSKHWLPRDLKTKKPRKRSKNAFQFLKNIKSSEPLPQDLVYDSRLQKSKDGKYYLCVLRPTELRPENQRPEKGGLKGVVAIDPGVRTFGTTYDPSGLIMEWGKKDFGRIFSLCRRIDKLQSKWSQKEVRSKQRLRLKKAAARLRNKVTNLVTDLHHKFAKWLCMNYHYVLLPRFETQQMVCRKQRKINSKTAWLLSTWSHYKFRQRLIEKAREYPWCKVIICDEHYTSKTCGFCGTIRWDLGGRKIFRCYKCNYVCDRDINASRNILLRYLTKPLRSGEQTALQSALRPGSLPLGN